jgi:ribosomal protein L4
MDEIKTKTAVGIFNTLAADPSTSKRRSESGHALVLGPRANADEKLLNFKRSVQNLPRVNYLAVDGLNLYDVLNHRFLIIREPEVNHLQEVLG